jgi:hypothetical protein
MFRNPGEAWASATRSAWFRLPEIGEEIQNNYNAQRVRNALVL